jgi:hypothetical protein
VDTFWSACLHRIWATQQAFELLTSNDGYYRRTWDADRTPSPSSEKCFNDRRKRRTWQFNIIVGTPRPNHMRFGKWMKTRQTEPESPMNESRLPISILCPTATESLRKEILGPFGIASHLIRWEQLRSGQRTTKSTDRVKTPTIPIVMQPLGIQGKSPTNIMRGHAHKPSGADEWCPDDRLIGVQ